MKRTMLCLFLAAPLSIALPGTSFATEEPPKDPAPGSLVGRVLVLANVPPAAGTCSVDLTGTGLKATCLSDGRFEVKSVPPGTYELHVKVNGLPERVVNVVQDAAENIGDVIVGTPGAVAGKVILTKSASDDDYDRAVVGVPEQGIYVQLGVGGQYLLTGLAPGTRTVVLWVPKRAVQSWTVTVANGGLTSGFDLPRVGLGDTVPVITKP